VVATIIDQTVMNSDLSDIGTALTASISADGQTTPTGNLPMGNFKHTGAGAATTTGQYVVWGQNNAQFADITATAGFINAMAGGPSTGFRVGTAAVRTVLTDDGSGNVYLDTSGGTNASVPLFIRTKGAAGAITLTTGAGSIAVDGVTASFIPQSNNTQTNGSNGQRWSNVFSVLGTYSGLLTGAAGVNVGNVAQAPVTTLDWYEEGTFTSAITGIGSPTYTTQNGEFQRVGNKVKFRISLVWTGGTNGFTIGTITGLPYSSTAQIHAVSIMANLLNSSLTFAGVPVAYLNGSSAIQIGGQASGASLASILNPNAGTKDIYIAGEYFV